MSGTDRPGADGGTAAESSADAKPRPGDGSAAGGRTRVLFVCTGNTCRSPLARALAAEAAGRRDLEDRLEFRSAGTFAAAGAPASRGAMIVGERHGLEIAGHRSRPLSADLLRWADLILCMDETHHRRVKELGGGAKAAPLTRYLPAGHAIHGGAIADPAGGGVSEYERVLEVLKEAVAGLLDELEA